MLPRVMMDPLGAPQATRAWATAWVTKNEPWEEKHDEKIHLFWALWTRHNLMSLFRFGWQICHLQVDLDDSVKLLLLHVEQEVVLSDASRGHTHRGRLEVLRLQRETQTFKEKKTWNALIQLFSTPVCSSPAALRSPLTTRPPQPPCDAGLWCYWSDSSPSRSLTPRWCQRPPPTLLQRPNAGTPPVRSHCLHLGGESRKLTRCAEVPVYISHNLRGRLILNIGFKLWINLNTQTKEWHYLDVMQIYFMQILTNFCSLDFM